MPSESHEREVDDLVGKSFDSEQVPNYPGRMYWYDGKFHTSFPHAPMRLAEIRLRESNASEDGDFTIYEARAIDSSNPEDSHSEWFRYTYRDTARSEDPDD